MQRVSAITINAKNALHGLYGIEEEIEFQAVQSQHITEEKKTVIATKQECVVDLKVDGEMQNSIHVSVETQQIHYQENANEKQT